MIALSKTDYGALAACAVAAVVIALLPQWINLFSLLSLTVYLVMALLALSLAFIWGFGGILCFGQAAFFGLGAYAYAVGAINLADSSWAVLLAVAVPALFAALLGYFMFYGGISDVYVGVITLAVTLILFNLLNASSGSEYRIGEAALGGFNGIPAIPTLNVPLLPDMILSPEALFIVAGLCLVAVYAGLRLTLGSRFGKTVIAIRENEQRAALLGYDVRLHKLLVFSIGGAIAGLAGCLYANWGAFISPGVFGLAQSAQIIIWVIVGGRGTLLGPILGCIALQWLVNHLGTQGFIDSGLVMGLVLMAFVMLLPKGFLPALQALTRRMTKRSKAELQKEGTP
ncbi:ABC transporter permease subunit [Vreelandella janggokensis]|uniref:ABC transporter permease subunit n=1 Tax=Vreelandella janggokensis TaxID=370767 RepID=UPI00285F5CE6|nr:branched-chain amino acid ABC transporter permease [Halomonas janggokensis]MDR5886431.1 branched-chain amino acid ABC transporter permease [Halomonas janggokensis]